MQLIYVLNVSLKIVLANASTLCVPESFAHPCWLGSHYITPLCVSFFPGFHMHSSETWSANSYFFANRNRNRFVESPSVRIAIGILWKFQNLWIGIGIIFVRWEVFANYSRTSEIYFSKFFSLKKSYSWLLYIFLLLKNLLGKQSHCEIYPYSLYIFNIRIRYS